MGQKSILIIDEEYGVVEAVESILLEEGFQVETCTEIQEAEKILDKRKFDLIISDTFIPVKESTPIILMSSMYPNSDEPKARGFLRKPFKMDQLIGTVKKALSSL